MTKDHEQFLSGNSADIQRYIDTDGLSYLNGINGTTLASLRTRAAEISGLKNHLPNPTRIVSIGVGQGEELHAIDFLYRGMPRIVGIDLSKLALAEARKRTKNNNLPVDLLMGNATSLPLDENSVDGVLLSSLMHEVYSYSPNGKTAWDNAIRESTRVIREDGCFLLRESAAPNLEGEILVQLRTDLAREFYQYFGGEYRKFNGWDDLRGKFSSNMPAFPLLTSDILKLSIGQAAELLFHFVNFEMGYPDDEILGNLRWKELNETYYTPKGLMDPEPMRTDQYIAEVIRQGNIQLSGTDLQLICAEKSFSVRSRMETPLSKHFYLALLGSNRISPEENSVLLKYFINKMELVFRKVRKSSN